MFADPEKVRSRRWKRRLKAGASIVLAMAAGAFLACKSRLDEAMSTTSAPAPSPRADGPEAGVNAGAEAGAPDAGAMDAGDGGSEDGGLDGGADAGDAGDGGVKKPRPTPVKKPQVDKREHQKGLPIRDMIE